VKFMVIDVGALCRAISLSCAAWEIQLNFRF